MKIVNSEKKSDYTVRKWRDAAYKRFEMVDDIKTSLAKWTNLELSKEFDLAIGYIEPGHGAKGRKRWLHDDSDLVDLYQLHKGKKEIMLWCLTVAHSERSRSRSPHSSGSSKSSTGTKPSSKVAQSLVSKRDQVDAIVQKLRDKHQDRFSPPQLNTWAHCIHMKTHSSYDDPPDKPFFRAGSSKHTKSSDKQDSPSIAAQASDPISPGKRINLRSKCMDQIEKWHQLFMKGIISEEQYKELVDKVWNDIKKF